MINWGENRPETNPENGILMLNVEIISVCVRILLYYTNVKRNASNYMEIGDDCMYQDTIE
jgi:hypothetical protein